MIRYLLLISIALNCACARKLTLSETYKQVPLQGGKDALPFYKFIEVEKDSVKTYHTAISSYGKYFSGISYFKNTADTSLRVLFTTYTGLKLLDLRLSPKGCECMYAMEQLNKPVVLNLLCHDYSLVSGFEHELKANEQRENSAGERILIQRKDKDLYYFADRENRQQRAVEAVAGKRKIQTEAYRNSDASLTVRHYNFNFKLDLKPLTVE